MLDAFISAFTTHLKCITCLTDYVTFSLVIPTLSQLLFLFVFPSIAMCATKHSWRPLNYEPNGCLTGPHSAWYGWMRWYYPVRLTLMYSGIFLWNETLLQRPSASISAPWHLYLTDVCVLLSIVMDDWPRILETFLENSFDAIPLSVVGGHH